MAARVLPYRIGLFTLLRELQYTSSQMSHEAPAAPYVPAFHALREEWMRVLHEEIGILDDLSSAQAAVNKADDGLDVFVRRVSRNVDEHTSGATRKQLRTALFKNKPLTKFQRPVLAGQLAATADWGETLAKCGVPALVALAAEVEPLVERGRRAEALLSRAQRRNRDFRDVGMRKQFIDKVNAERKEAYGGLSKLPFQNPALSADFAGGFFYSEPPREEEETIDEVKTSIEALEAELAGLRARLQQLEDEAAAAAQAEQERLANAQAADELEAKAAELLKQAAALKAKTGK
jgi:hypothetical protein